MKRDLHWSLVVVVLVFSLIWSSVLLAVDWSTVAERAIDTSNRQQAQYQEQLFYNLTHDRGIPFNTLVTKEDTEQDIDPCPQAHSLAVYLIAKGGKRRFTSCLREARMDRTARRWNRTFQKHYGMNLSQLQIAWVDWVKANQTSHAIYLRGGT